jgi:hypothetical protein
LESKTSLTEKQIRKASRHARRSADGLYEALLVLSDVDTLTTYDKVKGRGIRSQDIRLCKLRIEIGALANLLREYESWIKKNGVQVDANEESHSRNPAAHQANIGRAKRDLVKQLHDLWLCYLEKQDNYTAFIQDVCEFVEGKRPSADVILKRLDSSCHY